jgi:hypothetical protein
VVASKWMMWCLSSAFGPSWCHPSRGVGGGTRVEKKGAKGRSILDVSWRMPIVQLLTHSPNSQVDACAHFDFISGFFSSNKQKVCFVFFSLSRFAVSNFLSILFFASSTRKTNFAKKFKKKCLVVYQLQPKLMLRTMS